MESDGFFNDVESACEELAQNQPRKPGAGSARNWSELRIRRADLVQDVVTIPIQTLREAVSDLIKTSDDKETGQELTECNRRLLELREDVATFLSQRR
jgi:hypothetical protein